MMRTPFLPVRLTSPAFSQSSVKRAAAGRA
jgi:hypothetical protein